MKRRFKMANDLLTKPFYTIGKGENILYKFVGDYKTYTKAEWEEMMKQNIKDTCEVKDEVKQEAKPINKRNKKTKSTTD